MHSLVRRVLRQEKSFQREEHERKKSQQEGPRMCWDVVVRPGGLELKTWPTIPVLFL